MRPEKFRYEMDRAFNKWFDTDTLDEFKPLLREMKRVWPKWAKESNDYREGEDTYMYKTFESIHNNFFYVSDRWQCAFRLKWLIDGFEGGHFGVLEK